MPFTFWDFKLPVIACTSSEYFSSSKAARTQELTCRPCSQTQSFKQETSAKRLIHSKLPDLLSCLLQPRGLNASDYSQIEHAGTPSNEPARLARTDQAWSSRLAFCLASPSCTREGFRQLDQETLNGAVLCFASGTFRSLCCHFCITSLNLNQTSAAKNGAVEGNATSPCPSTRASHNKCAGRLHAIWTMNPPANSISQAFGNKTWHHSRHSKRDRARPDPFRKMAQVM